MQCVEAMQKSAKVAHALIDDVEVALLPWSEFGKGFIKKTKVSPDAFLQMALQLTYRKVRCFLCLQFIQLVYFSESESLLPHIRGLDDTSVPRGTH